MCLSVFVYSICLCLTNRDWTLRTRAIAEWFMFEMIYPMLITWSWFYFISSGTTLAGPLITATVFEYSTASLPFLCLWAGFCCRFGDSLVAANISTSSATCACNTHALCNYTQSRRYAAIPYGWQDDVGCTTYFYTNWYLRFVGAARFIVFIHHTAMCSAQERRDGCVSIVVIGSHKLRWLIVWHLNTYVCVRDDIHQQRWGLWLILMF